MRDIRRTIHNAGIAAAAALVLMPSIPALAQQGESCPMGQECPAHDRHHGGHAHQHHEKHMSGYYRGSKWVTAPALRYYGLNDTGGVAGAFATNGLGGFDDNTVGFSLLFYKQTDSSWQLGFGLTGLGESEEEGAFLGEYNVGYIGAWIAKDFISSPRFDIYVGSQLGFGASSLLILSGAADSRVEESFAYAEPTVGVGYAVTENVKLGLSAQYLVPVNLSTETNGDTLGLDEISPKTWSVQALLIFGTFR